MELLKPLLRDALQKSPSTNPLFQRNILKEHLQIVVLDFLYSHKKYSQLIFYGGSCLFHCHGLPRLSEDLDFIDSGKKINVSELAKDIETYFQKHTDLELKTTVQKFRIYLKFPLLQSLGVSKKGETDLLFLKLEIFSDFSFCKNFKAEIIPLFRYNRTLLVRSLDLPTLMSTKIRAILMRRWEKTDKNGKTLAKVKGRDYFDLMWYLQKGVKPNIRCIENVKDDTELKEKLLSAIAKADARSIRLDLEPLIDDVDFIKRLGKEMKSILASQISQW